MFFEKIVIFVLVLCPSNISKGYPPYYVIKVWKHFLLFEQLGTCPIYSYTKNLHGKKYILSKKENGSEDEKTLEWIISRLGENILPNLIGEICPKVNISRQDYVCSHENSYLESNKSSKWFYPSMNDYKYINVMKIDFCDILPNMAFVGGIQDMLSINSEEIENCPKAAESLDKNKFVEVFGDKCFIHRIITWQNLYENQGTKVLLFSNNCSYGILDILAEPEDTTIEDLSDTKVEDLSAENPDFMNEHNIIIYTSIGAAVIVLLLVVFIIILLLQRKKSDSEIQKIRMRLSGLNRAMRTSSTKRKRNKFKGGSDMYQ